MADYNNLLQSVLGLSQIVRGANLQYQGITQSMNSILAGGEISANGAELTAEMLRQTAQSVQASAQNNIAIDKINSYRQLQAISTQARRVFGRQLATAAGSNISVSSKSFLMLQAEASDSFAREILNMKADAINRQNAIEYDSRLKQTNLENQARVAEYRAASERVLAANRAAAKNAQRGQVIAGTIEKIGSSVPTLLSEIFD